ncbi:MAG: EutN/CcmL family microcompartment protein [Terriglobales bacterium]
MLLARVMGTVVATRKDERLLGKKLLVCRPVNPEGEAEGAYFVAVDTVGAGVKEMVLVVSGSSARMAANFKESPVDSSIVGIVDEVEMNTGESERHPLAAAAPAKSRR